MEKRGRTVVAEPIAQIWDLGVFWAIFFSAILGIEIRADSSGFV
jgi:hypothetical protein